MKKIVIIFLSVLLVGCGLKITPESRGVSSVSDTTQCRFIDSLYMQAMPYNMIQGVQQHVLNAGGDSYKIISTSSAKAIGLDVVQVNFEIYKCNTEYGTVDLKKQSKAEAKSSDSPEYAQKLRELKKLKDEGLLTDKEYEQKRKAIIDGM